MVSPSMTIIVRGTEETEKYKREEEWDRGRIEIEFLLMFIDISRVQEIHHLSLQFATGYSASHL